MKTTFLGLALLLVGCGGAPAEPPDLSTEMPDLSPMTADLSPATPDLSTAAPPDMAGPKVCAFDDDSFENGCLLAP